MKQLLIGLKFIFSFLFQTIFLLFIILTSVVGIMRLNEINTICTVEEGNDYYLTAQETLPYTELKQRANITTYWWGEKVDFTQYIEENPNIQIKCQLKIQQ